MDYYDILGLSKHSSQEEIEKAYKKLIKKFTPSIVKGNPFLESNYKQIREAYQVLGNIKLRNDYDMGLGGNETDKITDTKIENPFSENEINVVANTEQEQNNHSSIYSSFDETPKTANNDKIVFDKPEVDESSTNQQSDQSANSTNATSAFKHIWPYIIIPFALLLSILIWWSNFNYDKSDLKINNEILSDSTSDKEKKVVDNLISDSINVIDNNAFSGKELLSAVKSICKCEPISVSKFFGGKVYFLTEQEVKDTFEKKIVLGTISYDNGRWMGLRTQTVPTGYFDITYKDSEIKYSYPNYALVNDIEYYYSVVGLGHLGTANNGLESYAFVFLNPQEEMKPITLIYERTADKSWGEFSLPDGAKLPQNNPFVKEAQKFVFAAFGADDRNLNSINNFNLKWEKLNATIYQSVQDKEMDIPLRIIKFSGHKLFDKFKNEEEVISNGKYSVSAGFASPILAYDSHSNKTLVLYIPEGWPNGCCWGSRSFQVKSFDGQNVVAEDNDGTTLVIDIISETISSQ